MTGPPARPSRPTWRRRVREITTERLQLKAVALVVAALLWVVVGARQPTEGYVRVRVEPELDSSLVMLDGTSELQALVAGRAADLVKLYSTPLVLRRRVGGDVPDTLVLDVQPRSVMLRFEARATRRVAVVSDGRILLQGGRSLRPATDVEFEPRTVEVTGPRRAVRLLRGIRPRPLSIAEGDTLDHVADLDTASTGVRVLPTQVKVRVRPSGGTTAAAPSAP